jgi:hypothetical protein
LKSWVCNTARRWSSETKDKKMCYITWARPSSIFPSVFEKLRRVDSAATRDFAFWIHLQRSTWQCSPVCCSIFGAAMAASRQKPSPADDVRSGSNSSVRTQRKSVASLDIWNSLTWRCPGCSQTIAFENLIFNEFWRIWVLRNPSFYHFRDFSASQPPSGSRFWIYSRFISLKEPFGHSKFGTASLWLILPSSWNCIPKIACAK